MYLEHLNTSNFPNYLAWRDDFFGIGWEGTAEHMPIETNPLRLKVGDTIRVKNPPPIPTAKVVRFRLDGTPVVRWNHTDQDSALNKPELVEVVNDE